MAAELLPDRTPLLRRDARFERWTITPEIAQRWLDANTHNRNLSKGTVTRYAAMMRAGQWLCTMAEPITFDSDGVLQDGQHRLEAVVAAECEVEFWVAFGASPDDFAVINTGRRRTVSDRLGMEGYQYRVQRAAASRLVLHYRTNRARVWVSTGLAFTEIDVFQEAQREVYGMFGSSMNRAGTAKLPPTTLLAHAVLVCDRSRQPDDLSDFHERLITGASLAHGDPILTLRNWYLTGASRGVAGGHGNWVSQRRLACHIKAWNAWLAGESLRQLKYSQSNLPMPEVM